MIYFLLNEFIINSAFIKIYEFYQRRELNKNNKKLFGYSNQILYKKIK